MKYVIDATYSAGADYLIKEYPRLKDFGFEVERGKYWDRAYITLNGLDDLAKLIHAVGHPLVVGEGLDNKIEIYDGYRE